MSETTLPRLEIERQLERLYAILEKQECQMDKTQHIRGQIAGLKSALRMAGYEATFRVTADRRKEEARPIVHHAALY